MIFAIISLVLPQDINYLAPRKNDSLKKKKKMLCWSALSTMTRHNFLRSRLVNEPYFETWFAKDDNLQKGSHENIVCLLEVVYNNSISVPCSPMGSCQCLRGELAKLANYFLIAVNCRRFSNEKLAWQMYSRGVYGMCPHPVYIYQI